MNVIYTRGLQDIVEKLDALTNRDWFNDRSLSKQSEPELMVWYACVIGYFGDSFIARCSITPARQLSQCLVFDLADLFAGSNTGKVVGVHDAETTIN